jgi:hypothetical protein
VPDSLFTRLVHTMIDTEDDFQAWLLAQPPNRVVGHAHHPGASPLDTFIQETLGNPELVVMSHTITAPGTHEAVQLRYWAEAVMGAIHALPLDTPPLSAQRTLLLLREVISTVPALPRASVTTLTLIGPVSHRGHRTWEV